MNSIPCLSCFVSNDDKMAISNIEKKRSRRRRAYAWFLVSVGLFVFLMSYLQDIPETESCFAKTVGVNVYTSIYVALFVLFAVGVAGSEMFWYFLKRDTLGQEGG